MFRSLDATTRLILVLGIGCFSANIAGRVFDPLVNVLAVEFATNPATVALLASAFALPYALVQPVLGPVGDAVGKRRVIRASLLILAVVLALSALAPDLGSLAVLRVLAGAATGGVFPLCIATIGDQVPVARRQLALSRLQVAGLTGSAGGGAIAALLEPILGWRAVMLLCAAAAILSFLAMRDGAADAAPRRRLNLGEAVARYRHILSLRAARVLYAAVFIEGALVFSVFPFFAPLFAERGQGGVTEAGFAIAAFAGGGFAFAALAPMLLRRFSLAQLILLGGVSAMLALLGLALAPVAGVAIAACLLLGLGFYMIHTSIQTQVTEVAPQARGSAVALHAFSFLGGQAVGPVAMGAGRALLGAEAALLLASAMILALAFWLSQRSRGAGR